MTSILADATAMDAFIDQIFAITKAQTDAFENSGTPITVPSWFTTLYNKRVAPASRVSTQAELDARLVIYVKVMKDLITNLGIATAPASTSGTWLQ